MVFFIAIRFIPELYLHYHRIKLAQTARGATFGGSVLQRVRRVVPLLIPVVAASLRRSGSVADCLELRAWGAAQRRSFYQPFSFGITDVLLIVAILLLIVAVAIVSR
jgi:energy-coupling factor transport system permease protein